MAANWCCQSWYFFLSCNMSIIYLKNIMKKIFALLILSILCGNMLSAQENTKLLRYPNTSKTQLTFNYGGDVYVASIKGGYAQKITSSTGIEQMPRFSPDGKTIAFLAEYDGNNEVYTIPATGGEPFRVTYAMDMTKNMADRQGPDKIIMQWTDDGKEIIYRSRMESWNVLTGKLYRTSVDGSGVPQSLPVPRGGFCSLSPDGSKMAYNRIFREYRTWKRYRGGQADDIWIYDFKSLELKNITNNPAQDIIPMWAGNRIYFLSDRDKTMNLFCYELSTGQTRKVTNFTKYDVKFPSLGAEHIAFENGGMIYIVKLSDEEMQVIDIKIVNDFVSSRTTLENVSKNITGFDIAPAANRALFCARGDIFIVPTEYSSTRNITGTSDVHERNARWSPNGDWIAFISDKTGDDEVYLIQPDGKNMTQLTKDTKAYRYNLTWSPDSKKLINSDNARRLTVIDITGKTEKEIYKSKTYSVTDVAWSPDSRWISFAYTNPEGFSIINFYSLEQNKTYQITSEFYSSSDMVFSDDGKYLFFTSDRDFNPRVSSVEWNFAYLDMARV